MSLILCGMPGSGKSTVGRMLANKLQRPFFDTDDLIETHYLQETNPKLSCREITKLHGESYFRNLEKLVIKTLLNNIDCTNAIISTGGGTLLFEENTFHLQSIGKLIYLKTEPAILLHRILGKGIPAYLDSSDIEGSFLKLYQSRDPIFCSSCNFIFEVNSHSKKNIIDKLLTKFIVNN